MSAIPKTDGGKPITSSEHLKRQAAVDFACASVALEGFAVGEQAMNLFSRFIAGELDNEELNFAILTLAATHA